MNIIKILQTAFPQLDDAIVLNDKYSTFTIEYNARQPITVERVHLETIKKFIPYDDSFTIEVIMAEDDPIVITSSNYEKDKFIDQINKESKYLEDNETVRIKLSISKNTSDSIIHIYSHEHFFDFCDTISVMEWLDLVGKDLTTNRFLKFKVLEKEFDSFWSSNIIFSNTNRDVEFLNRNQSEHSISDNCHFGNYEQYPFNPSYFNLTKRPRVNNTLTNILDRLAFAFSIISIFDITSIDKNCLSFKVNGYKAIQNSFDIDKVDIISKDIYIKIYEWVYAENANCADKLGLTRNIISIYSKDELPTIDDNAYFSIQSGFKTYLQENLNKYIEIRNKISDQLLEISDRAQRVVENYLSYYQKSNITFVTFFISVFTIRALTTKSFSDVFSKETTLIALSLIAVSLGYMIVSLLGLNSEINRLKSKYTNIKNRFKDLLIEEDIDRILRNDKEFNDDVKYIKSRRLQYSILWVVTILIFTITTCYLSTYFCEIVKNIFKSQSG